MTNPGDIVRIHSRNDGLASVYEANMWAQTWSEGLFEGAGVVQNTSPDMNVLVGGSPSKPDVLLAQNPAGYKIALDIIGRQAVQITAPASNSRIASVVAYTDDLSLQSTDDSTTGSPSSCGIIVVYGSASANPSSPTESAIRSAITADGGTGSQAVFGVVAEITVASTTTAITSILISNSRAKITSDKINLATLSVLDIPDVEVKDTRQYLLVLGDLQIVAGIDAVPNGGVTISYERPFADNPVVTATIRDTNNHQVWLVPNSSNSNQVRLRQSFTGSALNASWIAIGKASQATD